MADSNSRRLSRILAERAAFLKAGHWVHSVQTSRMVSLFLILLMLYNAIHKVKKNFSLAAQDCAFLERATFLGRPCLLLVTDFGDSL